MFFRSKKPRTDTSTLDILPFADEDVYSVQVQEAHYINYGHEKAIISSTVQDVDTCSSKWEEANSWVPVDSHEFALDPDGNWHDEVVKADVMVDIPIPVGAKLKKKAKKKPCSKVSKRPHVVWKENYRNEYLDELCRLAGRGGYMNDKKCLDCLVSARPVEDHGDPIYRCGSECLLRDLVCKGCCVQRHRFLPLHRIEMWTGTEFMGVALKTLGLKVQLNHASLSCSDPVPCHQSMAVLHTNGIHEVAFMYCGPGCDKEEPKHVQLLRRQFYPASQLIPKVCATFQLLDLLHKFTLTTKAATYDFYRGLEKFADGTGLNTPRSKYRPLLRMLMQWRHLKMLLWAGRGHCPCGAEGTRLGELAVRCPSCPRPGINLPKDWKKQTEDKQYLYKMFACMDANFRLKNQLVSNYSQDPGLGIGMAFMVGRHEYDKYVLSYASSGDISTCVGFQAMTQANNRFSKGLRYTGVGGIFCGRSEMILPQGIGNLQKGERYANMDYICGAALREYHSLSTILISYDIACQWFVNLYKRMTTWPQKIQIPSSITLTPAIPKLHEPMHEGTNHQQFSLNFIPGVGFSDLETPERVWAAHNAVGNSTKTNGPGARQDILDDHFNFWNWVKYIRTGNTLKRKFKAAVAERNIQVEAHRGLTASLDNGLVKKWKQLCGKWEMDVFPKSAVNPYIYEGVEVSEAQVRNELAKEEETRLAKEMAKPLHSTSAGSFVVIALELEGAQRKLKRLAKAKTPTLGQEAGITEQRNQLRTRIRVWKLLLPIYIPGLLQHQTELAQKHGPTDLPEHIEDDDLWLPSHLPSVIRKDACHEGLSNIEKHLRKAQCHDALNGLRHVLRIKARLVSFKNKNVRGQREGTRSRAVIDRVHDRARAFAEKYRVARVAYLALEGPGEWENTLRVLEDGDIKSYQDPSKLKDRVGRQGTMEDGQVEAGVGKENEGSDDGEGNTDEGEDEEDIVIEDVERTKCDGTGETRRTLSWIWLSPKANATTAPTDESNENEDNEPDEGDGILRAEWCKSRARATRSTEEVELIKEEMRRTLAWLRWKSKWWLGRRLKRLGHINKDLAEGLNAIATKQSNLQLSLADRFFVMWKKPLDDVMGDVDAQIDLMEGILPEDRGKESDDDDDDDDEYDDESEDENEGEGVEEDGTSDNDLD